jgi:hypothetical protein
MTNRISSHLGLEWIRFLVSRRLVSNRRAVIESLTAMLEEAAFFQVDERQTYVISEWEARFGIEEE